MRITHPFQSGLAAFLCLVAISAKAGEPRSLIGSLPAIGASTASLGQSASSGMENVYVSVPAPTNNRFPTLSTASAPAGTESLKADKPAAVSPYVRRTSNPQVQQLLTRAEQLFVVQRYADTAKLLEDPRIAEHPHSRFLKGVLNEYGLSVPRNDVMAAEHYETAAAKGHAAAQYNLGLMYSDGRGVERMPDRALLWLELAANQGLADAQYALGLLYYNGAGTEQDFVVALKWFEVAAGYGHTSSAENIESLARTMNKNDVVKARQLASIWKPSVRRIPPE